MNGRRKGEFVGGFDFNYIEEPPDDLLCLICRFPAKEPMQMTCCGKVFCSNCLTEYNKRSKNCSNCRRDSGTSFNDLRSKSSSFSYTSWALFWPHRLDFTPMSRLRERLVEVYPLSSLF